MEKLKKWTKKTFSARRIWAATRFAVIVGVTYWATTIYSKAFEMENSMFWSAIATLLIIIVLLLIGGSFLDMISKE